MNTFAKLSLATSLSCFVLFTGCGSSGGDSTTQASSTQQPSTQSTSTSGVLVDPYIVGSTLYVDENNNSKYDDGELVSTKTDQKGKFTFDKELSAGKIVRIKEQGVHEGVTYDLNLSGVIQDDKTIKVISPLTTLTSKGLTTAQLAEILNSAAVSANLNGWSIDAAKLLSDPLESGLMEKKVGSLTDEELISLQASLASYGLIKIMKGSQRLSELSGTELYTSGTQNDGLVQKITSNMLASISRVLTKDLLLQVKTNVEQGQNALAQGIANQSGGRLTLQQATAIAQGGLPEPSMEVVVKSAVAVMDRIAQIGYDSCNATNGDDTTKVTTALGNVLAQKDAITNQAVTLGQKFYGMTYATNIATLGNIMGSGMSAIGNLPQELQDGYNAKNSGKKTFRFDENNQIVAK